MTAAYAFTDYWSQGQTILAVLVDIATPPSGGLMLFNLYVALSRSSGRSTLRLLRDFDDKLYRNRQMAISDGAQTVRGMGVLCVKLTKYRLVGGDEE